MTTVGQVDSLWRYPVKSMRGEQLDEAFVGFSGIYGDRLFAFMSAASPKGFPYLTAREQSDMLRYRPRFRHAQKAAQPVNLAEARSIDPGATPLYAVLNMEWAPKARHAQPVDYRQQEVSYVDLMEMLLEAGVDPNVRLKKNLWYTTYGRDMLGVNRAGATPFWRAAHATDVATMRLLMAYGADPNIPTQVVPSRRGRRDQLEDLSGLLPVPIGGPAVAPILAASGVGYGQGYAGNTPRHVPDGWIPAGRYLVEELGADVNARDHDGYSPVHHAAARGDN